MTIFHMQSPSSNLTFDSPTSIYYSYYLLCACAMILLYFHRTHLHISEICQSNTIAFPDCQKNEEHGFLGSVWSLGNIFHQKALENSFERGLPIWTLSEDFAG